MDGRLKLITNSYFIGAILLYVTIQMLRTYQISTPTLINNYLTDFLCLPIVIVFSTIGIRFLKRDKNYWPSLEMVLSLGLFFSIVFELVLPRISQSFTGDAGDMIAYFVGIVFYYLIIHKHN